MDDSETVNNSLRVRDHCGAIGEVEIRIFLIQRRGLTRSLDRNLARRFHKTDGYPPKGDQTNRTPERSLKGQIQSLNQNPEAAKLASSQLPQALHPDSHHHPKNVKTFGSHSSIRSLHRQCRISTGPIIGIVEPLAHYRAMLYGLLLFTLTRPTPINSTRLADKLATPTQPAQVDIPIAGIALRRHTSQGIKATLNLITLKAAINLITLECLLVMTPT